MQERVRVMKKLIKILTVFLLLFAANPIVAMAAHDKKQISNQLTKDSLSPEILVKNIELTNTNLPLGTEWKASDNFSFIELTDGTKLEWNDVESEIIVSGSVDPNEAGTYLLTYKYQGMESSATVTIKELDVATVQEISVKNSTIPVGSKWKASDNFNYILMSNGVKLNWIDVEKDIKIKGTVNDSVIGVYEVTYFYQDKVVVAKITVKDMEPVKVQDIILKDSCVSLGGLWNVKDNFDYVLLQDGTKLSWENIKNEIKIKGHVDTKVSGTYKVLYSYQDKEKTATINVKSMPKEVVKEISTKNLTIVVGSKWSPQDSFNYVGLEDGKKLNWNEASKKIIVSGNNDVNVNKPGEYKVTYTYNDKSEDATIKVILKEEKIKSLPKTGEKFDLSLFILGITMITTSVVLLIIKKKI